MSQFLSSVAASAGESAIRSIVVALAAGSILAVTRSRHARLRLLTWTGVLYISMMMPLLAIVLPAINLRILPGIAVPPSPPNGASQASQAPAPAAPDPLFELIRPVPPASTHADAGSTAARENTVVTNETFIQGRVTPPDTAAPPAATAVAQLAWRDLATILYVVVAAIMLARVATGLILGRRLRRQALEIRDPELSHILDQLCGRARRSAHVIVAESLSVSIPLATGAVNPMILLPPGWHEWDSQKLRAVLAHELSHVARRDALTQLFSAIHRSIFWFSPLPWWLHRRLVDLAEQASDDSALLAIKDPAFYAEVLLGFFQSLSAVPARWLGVSMARGDRAGRRIERMLSGTAPSPSQLETKVIAAVTMLSLALAVPAASLKIGRASAQDHAQTNKKTSAPKRESSDKQSPPSTSESAPIPATGQLEPVIGSPYPFAPTPDASAYPAPAQQTPAGQQPAQQAPPAPAPFAAQPALTPLAVQPAVAPFALALPPQTPMAVVVQGVAPMALPPTAALASSRPFALVGPTAPVIALPPPANQLEVLRRLVTPQNAAPQDAAPRAKDDGMESIVISKSNGSTHFTGTWRAGDGEKIKALRGKIKEDFIWFKYKGQGYIITDPEIIKSAEAFFAAHEDVTALQAELSRRLAEISQKQADISRQLAAVKVDNPDLVAELNKLVERMKSTKTQDDLESLQARIALVQAKLAAAETEIALKQSLITRFQGDLASEQAAMAQQQSLLSREEARRATEANRKVRALLERALSNGLAKPEP
jgi:beta-lactamase regulating signal transducer with metallopeptidase domain